MENSGPHQWLPYVALFVPPGIGHLNPLAELACRLAADHGVPVALITLPSTSEAHHSILNSLSHPLISKLTLPAADITDIPNATPLEFKLLTMIQRSIPLLKGTLESLDSVVALVTDMFGIEAFTAARDLKIRHYLFFPCSMLTLIFSLKLPSLHSSTAIAVQFRDLPEPLRLPGCPPLHGSDLMDVVQDRKSEAFRWVLQVAEKFREAECILVNSFEELEPAAAKIFRDEVQPGWPLVYPVGPLVRSAASASNSTSTSSCIDCWLSKQPDNSVVYVSFGSAGVLSTAQMMELALGLENSRQRFLWVVRCPSDTAANEAFFTNANNVTDPLKFLPDGFVERTKSIGMVISSWAPQLEILSHVATGGFISHCGWNSTIEAVKYGVPMIAFPLFGEQRMNAVLMSEAGAALRPVPGEDGVVRREEVARVVREIIAGEEGTMVKETVKKLKDAAKVATSEKGSSYKGLAEVAVMWRNKLIA